MRYDKILQTSLHSISVIIVFNMALQGSQSYFIVIESTTLNEDFDLKSENSFYAELFFTKGKKKEEILTEQHDCLLFILR
jgi:hypothetical protein